ncbi:MAG: iron-containing alcohol dehydrogenase [Atopobium sp.]|uniref:iron-containing alcohol dehydrogenase n=1 Tax=Atopobium sp. TaxID=1872650 RepID=UPI002A80A68D|nr:iron-containing alcohol dehydrogenase [Atopobium sp.]MDY4523327.1 iron-containing alcohol dehydrogenase [Atopobium sp.]
MNDFVYYTPTRVVFGRHSEEKLGALVAAAGAHTVLLHYGSGSVQRTGVLDRAKQSLSEAGIAFVELGGVVPNPRLSLVREGIELARNNKVDFIVALGGGSVIDSAKAIGYGVANEGDVWDFYLRTRKPTACLPIGVILTISASGSEMSSSSVITDDACKDKRSCNTNFSRPVFAIMNPELLYTLPAYQTACGTTDILMHTMERYFTNGPTMELTDSLAEGLMRTVLDAGIIVASDPYNYDARAELMWAGSLSHNGLTGCGGDGGDFVSHNLEHQMSGMFDVAHGAGLAAIWGSWARYVYKDCLDRFVRFARNVMLISDTTLSEEDIALAGICSMEDYFHCIGMPTTMRELGITPTDAQLQEMAHQCAQVNGGSKGSAKRLYEQDFLAIYRMAL